MGLVGDCLGLCVSDAGERAGDERRQSCDGMGIAGMVGEGQRGLFCFRLLTFGGGSFVERVDSAFCHGGRLK